MARSQRPPLSPEDDTVLAQLETYKPSGLLPLLLELARRQSARRRPADLLRQLERDPFVEPSKIDLRTSARFDQAALDAAPGHEAILLSPLTPQGTCSVISPTTQDRSLTTPRSIEVVSDPTNVMALECARRLKTSNEPVRLMTLHQVVRPQRYPPNAGWSQHFRLFALAEAGPATAEHGFEVTSVISLASVFLRLFDICERELGCSFPNRRAMLHVGPDAKAKVLGERVKRRLAATHPTLAIEERALESTYYDGIRLLVGADATFGELIEIGDIGVFDWLKKLTSNGRLRFVAAGLGIQLVPLLFRVSTSLAK